MSSSTDEIIFYDLKCGTPNKTWSPHCWKTRLVLQYKRIPFRTVWVSYPDIKATVGHTQPDAETVTLPVIKHGETWVADSWNIVRYIEKHFPSPPLLHPSEQAVHFFMAYMEGVVLPPVRPFIVPRIADILDERGQEYFIRTREKSFGKSLAQVKEGTVIDPIRPFLGPAAKSLHEYGPYLGGDQISYADLILLGSLSWIEAAEHEALEKILKMYNTPEGKPVFGEWYERVKYLAVNPPEA